MFIILWVTHQLVLTYQEIRHEVTIPHVFTGVVLYTIVHTAAKTGHNSAKRAEQLFKSEAQRRIYNHVHGRHQGKPVDCPDCATIVTIDEMTI